MGANRVFAEAMERDDDDDDDDDEVETDEPPRAPGDELSTYDKLQDSLLEAFKDADKDLARRTKEREALAPVVYGLIRQLASLVDSGQIEEVKLEHFEPGEYGESGDIEYPQRIQFSWRVIGYDHQYSNSPDFFITLMGDQPR